MPGIWRKAASSAGPSHWHVPRVAATRPHANPVQERKETASLRPVVRLVCSGSQFPRQLGIEEHDRFATARPFLVPPKHKTSTPAFQVTSFGATLKKRPHWQNARRPFGSLAESAEPRRPVLASHRANRPCRLRSLGSGSSPRLGVVDIRSFIDRLLDRFRVHLALAPGSKSTLVRWQKLRCPTFGAFDMRKLMAQNARYD